MEADRQTIAENTAEAPVIRDLRPTTEYYLSYPYAWSLASGNLGERLYSERNKSRFTTLLAGAEPSQ